MPTLHRAVRGATLAILALMSLVTAVADAEVVPLKMRAEFGHLKSAGAYRTRWKGVTDVDFTQRDTGNAQAVFALGQRGCFMIASWRLDGASPRPAAGPAEICLADSVVTEAQFNAWMNRKRRVDPSLTIPLAPRSAARWTNPSPVVAQAFLRGCEDPAYRSYGKVRAEPGMLTFTTSTDTRGQFQIDVSGDKVKLEKIVHSTWLRVRNECGGTEAGLPDTPMPGQSLTFSGTSQQSLPDPDTPHGQIVLIGDGVDALVAGGVLSSANGKVLNRLLDRATTALRRGQPDAALRALNDFGASLTGLVRKRRISSASADPLLAQAHSASTKITDRIAIHSPRLEPEAYCEAKPDSCPSSCSQYTRYHVDTRSRVRRGVDRDGSQGRPFRTIADALAHAESVGNDCVSLDVRFGLYAGDLVISRNTQIRGVGERRPVISGSIHNTGPYELTIEKVVIGGSTAPEGAVFVDNACARTSLTDVTIAEVEAYGIRQRGGALTVTDSTVLQTQAQPAFLSRGTGVYLTCGVHAALLGVVLDQNQSGGLHAAGVGTEVLAARLYVNNTGVHPQILETGHGHLGAVHVRKGALLTVFGFEIRHNQDFGVVVSSGGEAHLSDGTIRDTRAIPPPVPNPTRASGFSASVDRDGYLEMTNFVMSHADLVGISILPSGAADLHWGEVSHNQIGANLHDPDYDVDRLQDHVLYRDNVVNSNLQKIPDPPPIEDLDL